MPPLTSYACALTILLASPASSHFILNYPPSLGFDADNEDRGPCGGFSPTFSHQQDYHVAGDSIALTSLHPQSTWLFRATLDATAAGAWTNLLPVVGEYGLGAFCEAVVPVPASYAGSVGLIQVIQDAEDGVHYQCAAVNFVTGQVSTLPSACVNASGVSASFTSDTVLLPPPGSPVSTSSGLLTGSTVSSATPSTTKSSGSSSLRRLNAGNYLWRAGCIVFGLLTNFYITL